MNSPLPENGSRPEDGQAVEQQLARCAPAGGAAELRTAVLGQVRRELRAARWDRRLGRAAAVLLAVGIGTNGVVQWLFPPPAAGPFARPSPQTIGRLAATVAEATDMETARQLARQMAALQGWSPRGKEVEIIQRGIERPRRPATPPGKDG